jgi:sugar/nucleoside kinase (ribokinase family)
MTVRVGVRGGLSVDHLVLAEEGSRFSQLGGPGLYAALGARLVAGTAVTLATALPRDDPRFQSTFTSLGIEVEHASSVASVPHVWILNSGESRRIVETTPTGPTELESPSGGTNPTDAPAAPSFYHQLDGLLESSPLARPPAEGGTIVGIDPHQLPLHREGIGYLEGIVSPGTILLPSRVQLNLIDPDPRAAARQLSRHFDTTVYGRLDRDGMYIAQPDTAWILHDNNVRVTETTGAGDSSAAAIIAALALGADAPTAALFGASVARIALSGWGDEALRITEPLVHPLNRIKITQES